MKRLILVLAILATCVGSASAQYVTTHAKTATPGQQNGLYYSLPRTVLRLDFLIEETQLLRGPYSDYVGMIGADDYITYDDVAYRIQSVTVVPTAEADPNATFFVSMNWKKGDAAGFTLTPKGILYGFGVKDLPAVEESYPPVQSATLYSDPAPFKYQYGSGRNMDQAARSAVEMISKIRDEKIKLMTGFQETAFNLDTYRQMYADLDQMEQDYLSLFVGKRQTRTFVKTVYVTPNKEVAKLSVAKFSTEFGLSVGTAGEGDLITVQTQSLQTTGAINAPSQSAVESLSLDNKLFYRIPETANVKVSLGSEVILEQRATIAQYGVFMLAPLGKTKLVLDPNTGQVVSMTTE